MFCAVFSQSIRHVWAGTAEAQAVVRPREPREVDRAGAAGRLGRAARAPPPSAMLVLSVLGAGRLAGSIRLSILLLGAHYLARASEPRAL
jgi:hypothetical protein